MKPVEELKKLLSSGEMPTGLVCYNDELALCLLDVLREKNLKVPQDISIVGYDDSFLAQASEVKLTTVKHPKNEMGETAAKMIVELVKAKDGSRKADVKVEAFVYEPELVVRSSTRKL